MQEIWKAIPGYEGLYEVSDQGRVRSLARRILCEGTFLRPHYKYIYGRILRPILKRNGHLKVTLSKGGHESQSVEYISRLVLLTFVGPSPTKCECLHLNNDLTDNRLENLFWGAKKDKVRLEQQYKLKMEDIKAIKCALKTPYHGINRELKNKYGVSDTTISNIRRGRQHGWVSVD